MKELKVQKFFSYVFLCALCGFIHFRFLIFRTPTDSDSFVTGTLSYLCFYFIANFVFVLVNNLAFIYKKKPSGNSDANRIVLKWRTLPLSTWHFALIRTFHFFAWHFPLIHSSFPQLINSKPGHFGTILLVTSQNHSMTYFSFLTSSFPHFLKLKLRT